MMTSLSMPINFVCPEDDIWPELSDRHAILTPEKIALHTETSVDCWIIRTWYELRQAGEPVLLSPHVRSDMVNVCDAYRLGRRNRTLSSFIVLARGDSYASPMANFTIGQNNLGMDDATLPLWPQPGLKKRDSKRGTRLKTIAFKGDPINLDAELQTKSFLSELQAMEVTLNISPQHCSQGRTDWSDYQNVDAILAVRNLTTYDASNKPASKLINSWIAEVPAILGPEPAYFEVRKSDLDFIVVSTPTEAIEAINNLKMNPLLYKAMIDNGRNRKHEFSVESIRQKWIIALDKANEKFSSWKKNPRFYRVGKSAMGIIGEAKAKRNHRKKFQYGERILRNCSKF